MKLINKISGEVRTFELFDGKEFQGGVTLERLVEEWEDYEPKEYWYISSFGNLCKTDMMDDLHRGAKEIGNYFETKEDAEKAVEKLRAWKRLKDKRFKFNGCDDYHIDYKLTGFCAFTDQTEKDLDLLFSQEDN